MYFIIHNIALISIWNYTLHKEPLSPCKTDPNLVSLYKIGGRYCAIDCLILEPRYWIIPANKITPAECLHIIITNHLANKNYPTHLISRLWLNEYYQKMS